MIADLKRTLKSNSKNSTARHSQNITSGIANRPFKRVKLETGIRNKKLILFLFLLTFPSHSMAAWVEYSTEANGDVFFYDDARVQRDGNHINVWNRVRYKTSLMGAFSYQSFLRIDCSEYSQKTLQSTFFSDKDWAVPAMATNTRERAKTPINLNSALARLANILCKK